ncbi:hypothetical protein L1987_19184 [Smallanthus sonchifolius]|uniref:Uncharacterized protein n=1 Tax=Smallanthus sonchifolius TaxID=185202 RepID=A0ACB9IMU7_9ASTR|nr:hypothetical protein L1987_19184 [Smallanthus sonchifolius]
MFTRLRIHPSKFFSSNLKKPNFIDDIRESASRLPPASSSSADNRVNVVKTSTASDRRENDGTDMADFVADTAKQGVAKAVETGLGIGEMCKKTLDAAKDTVAGDDEKKNGKK